MKDLLLLQLLQAKKEQFACLNRIFNDDFQVISLPFGIDRYLGSNEIELESTQ